MGRDGTLERVMQEYVEAYEALLALARKKQAILLSGNPDELESVVRCEEVLLTRVSGVERRCAVALEDSAGELNEAALAPLAKRLQDALAELRRVGAKNILLLRQALQYVRFSLSLIDRASGEAMYEAGGSVSAAGRRSVMDRRA